MRYCVILSKVQLPAKLPEVIEAIACAFNKSNVTIK